MKPANPCSPGKIAVKKERESESAIAEEINVLILKLRDPIPSNVHSAGLTSVLLTQSQSDSDEKAFIASYHLIHPDLCLRGPQRHSQSNRMEETTSASSHYSLASSSYQRLLSHFNRNFAAGDRLFKTEIVCYGHFGYASLMMITHSAICTIAHLSLSQVLGLVPVSQTLS